MPRLERAPGSCPRQPRRWSSPVPRTAPAGVSDLKGADRMEPALAAASVHATAPRRTAILALGAERGLLDRLHPDADHLEAEVAWAVEQELALSLDDILARRLRLAIETRDHGASVATRVAAIVGGTLGWDAERQAAEVATYTVAAAKEYGVP